MVMYSTLEDIQTGMQDSLFSDDQINLRSEQRDANRPCEGAFL